MKLPIANRRAAGQALASALSGYRDRDDTVVLALPRGGVPVAVEIARELNTRLDLMIVRKLGTPGHEELAMGAIASGGGRAMNEDIVRALGISAAALERVARKEQQELERREQAYRGDRPRPELAGQCVILVDDGLATGATMRAAVGAVRSRRPARIVVAVPVAPPDTVKRLQAEADEVICLEQPEPFRAIGLWYADFTQVSDDEVRQQLADAWRETPASSGVSGQQQPMQAAGISIQAGAVALAGDLVIPGAARGLVVFAHGSGSSRFSSRNRYVAGVLNEGGLATLLFDLLTAEEHAVDQYSREFRFDIAMLSERLVATLDWLGGADDVRGLPIGLFGASTGAAAALNAAAARSDRVAAVVSRGGRPDLAMESLPQVRAPTLLIVGGRDLQVIELNRLAASALTSPCRVELVAGATHLFEEPGTLEQVAAMARDWFLQHLPEH